MKKQIKKTLNRDEQIKKILVPFDFSICSSSALREAILIAKVFKAKLELIHVVTPVYITQTSSSKLLPTDDVYYRKMMKQAQQKINDIAKEIFKSDAIKITTKTSLNTVYAGILNHAKKTKVNLIVMGTHGTSGIKEFFAGSNAYRVVRESICPVITIQKKITKNGFKTIVLPIRTEMNSRQKVNLVASLSKKLNSKVLIVGYTEGNNKNEEIKVDQYVNQIKKFLLNENIYHEARLINQKNFVKSIIDIAKKNKADLIAVMTHHDFSLNQLINGAYAQQFVNHSKIPILAIPDVS